jgi:tetratricopeptide (TPR) repeat protein
VTGRVLLCVAALAAGVGAAHAGGFWERVAVDPEAARVTQEFEAAMALGDDYALRLAHGGVPQPGMLLERAVKAYEEAARLVPTAPEPHYRAAELLYKYRLFVGRGPINPRTARKAIEHWKRFEELSPLDPRIPDMLFRRALAYTKLATEDSLHAALADYQSLLERRDVLSMHPGSAAITLSNMAETMMMVGRLDDAIPAYIRAVEAQADALYAYGLAVALDRDGQGEKARQIMADFAASDRLRRLTSDGVFFVPEGEIHYYLALGHESLGEHDRAIEHYERFLASGAHPRYQDRARENLARLRALSADGPRPARGARR